ncbi:hypothetical protein CASFOL_018057 [Castilleja foliolosa]|uniref:Uncharacterized protein n=1 Tax=Castilleja foliolosa TaxID=1961234 RepID=A0ABD3D9Z7_9LAMI
MEGEAVLKLESVRSGPYSGPVGSGGLESVDMGWTEVRERLGVSAVRVSDLGCVRDRSEPVHDTLDRRLDCPDVQRGSVVADGAPVKAWSWRLGAAVWTETRSSIGI